jgi:carbonic anhydrase
LAAVIPEVRIKGVCLVVLFLPDGSLVVPANQIIDLAPGEVFVHRNIANVVVHTDMNLLSVVQFAVDVLKVRHVIVVGHYGCGGVAASMQSKQYGLVDNWLRNLKDLYAIHRKKLEAIPLEPPKDCISEPGCSGKPKAAKAYGMEARCDLLCELNVARSLYNLCHTTVVQNAWARGQEISIHGGCYRVADGLIR